MNGSIEIDITRLDIDESMAAIRADLEWLLTERYLSLVQQLIGSPTAALSAPELVARNPDVPESTLRSRLTELRNRERPLVIKLQAGDGEDDRLRSGHGAACGGWTMKGCGSVSLNC